VIARRFVLDDRGLAGRMQTIHLRGGRLIDPRNGRDEPSWSG